MASRSSSKRPAGIRDTTTVQRSYEWRGRTANGHELNIQRVPTGMWRVIYGGFSRSTSASLVAALGEATGSPTSAAWISTLVKQLGSVEDAPQQQRHGERGR